MDCYVKSWESSYGDLWRAQALTHCYALLGYAWALQTLTQSPCRLASSLVGWQQSSASHPVASWTPCCAADDSPCRSLWIAASSLSPGRSCVATICFDLLWNGALCLMIVRVAAGHLVPSDLPSYSLPAPHDHLMETFSSILNCLLSLLYR